MMSHPASCCCGAQGKRGGDAWCRSGPAIPMFTLPAVGLDACPGDAFPGDEPNGLLRRVGADQATVHIVALGTGRR
jgi:hypothetical protein